MRLNESKGVADVLAAIQGNWQYLRLGDVDTTYDGSNVTDIIGTLSSDKQSYQHLSSTDATSFTRYFTVPANYHTDKTITKLFDATASAGTVVHSYEQISGIESTSERKFRITIKTEILR